MNAGKTLKPDEYTDHRKKSNAGFVTAAINTHIVDKIKI